MAARKKPLELNVSGIQIFNGVITGDEYRPELRGRQLMRTIEEMRRGDATVHAGLMAVKQPIIAADYYAEAGGDDAVDEQAKELIDFNFAQVLNWKAVLTKMPTMLEFGFSVAELVFDWRNVNGTDRIVLSKIAYRKQTTIEKWTQEDGTPGIVQCKTDGTSVSIPDEKLLVLTHQQEGDNWMGVSMLRSAYQNWYFKKNFYQMEAVKHERQALGVVKIKFPKNAKEIDKENARRAAMNVRANEQAFIKEPEGFDINFMDMMARTTSDPTNAINHHDRQILKNMAVQYIDIGSSGSSGSFAASNDQRELLEQQDQAIAEQIAAEINEKVVKAIIDMNFTVTDYPKWKVDRIAKDSVETLSDAVAKMTTAKLLTPTNEDEAHVRKVLHFPDMPEDLEVDRTIKKTEAKDKDAADDVEGSEEAEKTKVDASRKPVKRIAASVSSKDFAGLHEGLGIDTKNLGCIMLNAEALEVTKHVEDGEADLIPPTDDGLHQRGAVAERRAHVTLLFGLLRNGNI
ncbi:phage portal protein family protein [Rhodococcoides kyotonense]|uniref:DUF935 family protein n=1 Tax=Rhodococcoides kyotonense TaxID=398843 RepID=A0A239MXJ2_9NOCA|nr:DUF935 family protein [Rhodococcus kyotonensis]SNT46688.1 Protein of unknown function [Rhodococcus kyotonensis]